MKLLIALFALGCISLVLGSDVVVLDESNFFDHVGKDKAVFVEFYAPWCGHCKNLAPEYEKVATAFKGSALVSVANVDADAHKSLGSKFDVKGFPTLKWFPAGSTTPESFDGDRSLEGIARFIEQKSGAKANIPKPPPTAVTVLDASNFASVALDPTKDVLVEFYAPWCGHCKKLAPDYEKLAQIFKGEANVVIANMDADEAQNKDTAAKYGVSGFPTLKWFGKDNKDEPVAYDSGRDIPSFIKYINEHAGTHRNEDGLVTKEGIVIEQLSSIVSSFASSLAEERAELRQKAASVVASLEGAKKDIGDLYLKTMDAVSKRGAEFINTEIARLQGLLEKAGSVAASKKELFNARLHILQDFVSDE